jgi:hypothetical protein
VRSRINLFRSCHREAERFTSVTCEFDMCPIAFISSCSAFLCDDRFRYEFPFNTAYSMYSLLPCYCLSSRDRPTRTIAPKCKTSGRAVGVRTLPTIGATGMLRVFVRSFSTKGDSCFKVLLQRDFELVSYRRRYWRLLALVGSLFAACLRCRPTS